MHNVLSVFLCVLWIGFIAATLFQTVHIFTQLPSSVPGRVGGVSLAVFNLSRLLSALFRYVCACIKWKQMGASVDSGFDGNARFFSMLFAVPALVFSVVFIVFAGLGITMALSIPIAFGTLLFFPAVALAVMLSLECQALHGLVQQCTQAEEDPRVHREV